MAKKPVKKPIRKPYLTAAPSVGNTKQVGFLVDPRFHKTFKEVAEEKGYTFSQVTRGLQENWLKKQLDKKSA